ncbi:MAG: InlB B-repeat-containing protein [Rickettsiales bacterium]|jgi:hypothetical protein|nr:InlB B-repeat-containing protein [Rickettsiales bacterium]
MPNPKGGLLSSLYGRLTIFSLMFLFALHSLPAFAASYECPAYKKYTSCAAGYYMTRSSLTNACYTTPVAGNACLPCSAYGAGYTCAGGTACPGMISKTLTITYDLNGGFGTVNSTICTVNVLCYIETGDTIDFFNPGHILIGWNTNPRGIGESYKESGTFSESITLYAMWTACEPGTYKFKEKANAKCNLCDPNYYCPDSGTLRPYPCEDLANGFYPYSKSGAESENECYTNIPGGSYLYPSGASTLSYCTRGTYKRAHSVYYGDTSECDACPAGTTSPLRADEDGDCGRVLHYGDNSLILRSSKKTNPSLSVKVGQTTYYGNMITNKYNDAYCPSDLIINLNETNYYVNDEEFCY